MKHQQGFTIIGLLYCALAIFIAIGTWGWVWNIMKLVDSEFVPITAVVVVRCFGVFIPPLGAVMGFL